MGTRKIILDSRTVYIEKSDLKNNSLRLKEFADFDIVNNVATFISSQRSDSRKIIHWTSLDSSKEADLLMVMDNEIVKIPGMIESHNLENGTHVQIERIGYGVIAANNQIIFTHD